jgi:hypothetical protein
MIRPQQWAGLWVMTLAASGLYAQPCTLATMRGDWGYAITGTRPSPPNGPMETVIGTSVRRYDGVGGFTQVSNLHGSVSGYVPDLQTKGTYTVNPDCSGVVKLEVPGVPFQPEERFVIVDDGNGIFSASTTPAPLLIQTQARRMNNVRGEAAGRAEKSATDAIDEVKKLVTAIAFRLGLLPPASGN